MITTKRASVTLLPARYFGTTIYLKLKILMCIYIIYLYVQFNSIYKNTVAGTSQ